VDGAAYPAQFSDAKVVDPLLSDLRRKVKFKIVDGMGEDQVELHLTMKDGSVLSERIEHATGSPENPMSDQRLEEKFMTLAAETLGHDEAFDLLGRLWRLDEIPNVAGLVP
jgi:2-methylcitrate dehydratase PrpD